VGFGRRKAFQRFNPSVPNTSPWGRVCRRRWVAGLQVFNHNQINEGDQNYAKDESARIG